MGGCGGCCFQGESPVESPVESLVELLARAAAGKRVMSLMMEMMEYVALLIFWRAMVLAGEGWSWSVILRAWVRVSAHCR